LFYDVFVRRNIGRMMPPVGRHGVAPQQEDAQMGFFSKILDKLGFDAGDSKVTEALRNPAAPARPATGTAGAGPAVTPGTPTPTAPAASAGAAPKAMSQVDVAAQLEQKAAANSQKLNWRTSIVDLLKLLDIDSSLQARKELATELGAPADVMADSAKMNTWLHKAVMQKLAATGGKVPAEFLD
jgi:hypothetical protein